MPRSLSVWASIAALVLLSAPAVAAEPLALEPGGGRRPEIFVQFACGVALTDKRDAPGTPEYPFDDVLLGRPTTLGAELGLYWLDRIGVNVWGSYQFDIHRWQLLAGPRLRVRLDPLLWHVGVNAGVMVLNWSSIAQNTAIDPKFGVSPDTGLELAIGPISLGIRYALDVPVVSGPVLSHRLMLTEGVRF